MNYFLKVLFHLFILVKKLFQSLNSFTRIENIKLIPSIFFQILAKQLYFSFMLGQLKITFIFGKISRL